jgi:hypothetical protein
MVVGCFRLLVQSSQNGNCIRQAIMGRRQKGARQQSIVAYVGPRASCRSGIFYLKPFKAIEARAALFDSAFREVEPHPNRQSRGDHPAPLTHMAEVPAKSFEPGKRPKVFSTPRLWLDNRVVIPTS